DLPLCYQDVYLNEVLLPGFMQTGLPESLYSLLAARGLRPLAAEDQLTADLANAVDADLLELHVGDPVLRHSRRGLVGDVVIELSGWVSAGARSPWGAPPPVKRWARPAPPRRGDPRARSSVPPPRTPTAARDRRCRARCRASARGARRRRPGTSAS